jgi:hypothetical protein
MDSNFYLNAKCACVCVRVCVCVCVRARVWCGVCVCVRARARELVYIAEKTKNYFREIGKNHHKIGKLKKRRYCG